METYNSGDIVRVFYPFKPKALSNDTEEQVGKRRFGLVINAGNNRMIALPILQITSHGGRTEQTNHKLRADEIKVPESVTYYKRSAQGNVPVYGVIKTERIEFFDDDEISMPLTSVGLDTKIAVLKNYKELLKKRDFVKKRDFEEILNEESPGHKEAMECFERAIIAEKLNFLTTDQGECKYEHMEDEMLKVNKIQPLGKSDTNKRIHFYAVELTGKENMDSFFYTFASMKQPNQVVREWGKPKTAVDWLKEDERFYNLQKDISKMFKEPPNPHPNKYKAFSLFRKNTLENAMER
ncbi:TPA: hypothetical protein QCZ17_004469 [Bacillus cereus]|nr:hypothetical protein [Bacillus cereus]